MKQHNCCFKKNKTKTTESKSEKNLNKMQHLWLHLSLQKRDFKEEAETCVIEAIKQGLKLTENSANLDNLNRRYQVCLFPSLELCYSGEYQPMSMSFCHKG